MARKFEELEAKMSRDAIARSDARYMELKADMALEELRDALRLTQQQLAKTLNVDQSAISKLERRLCRMSSSKLRSQRRRPSKYIM